jgi:hypothetical protein
MTRGQQDTTSCLHLSDDMACSRRAENAMLPNNEFFDAIRCTDFCDQLHHFWVVVSPISTNDEECALNTFGDRE